MTVLSDRDLAGIRDTLADLPDGVTTNCTLLELRAAGDVDDYGEIADAETGDVQWEGEVSAHLRRSRDLEAASRGSQNVPSQGSTVVEADEIAVFRFALPDAVLAVSGGVGVGWTVLFDDLRPVSSVRRRARLAGVVSEGDGVLADKVVFRLDSEEDGT